MAQASHTGRAMQGTLNVRDQPTQSIAPEIPIGEDFPSDTGGG